MDKSKKQQPKTPMTPDAGSRIQSHADKTQTNQSFKSRAQSAGDKNANKGKK
ncbi:hypothetical protein BJV82DRAFT_614872 [Fennellomyces sp. T-0311]|nr:hypothetical protein BJV82DRAFT_614872 [Fennellomyces sp. T-0311]